MFGAAPPPRGRPNGEAAPAGARPVPGQVIPNGQAPMAGTINPWYVVAAVTVGVFVTMVIYR